MSNRSISASRDVIRRNAQSHFQQSNARTDLVRKIVEDERNASDTKTAKLRSLRLAKEEDDRRKVTDESSFKGKTAVEERTNDGFDK